MNDISYAEDARLIAAIQNQDHEQEAFEALYRKYYKLVLFIANKECANESDAQDILQETFIEIKKSIPKLRKPQYFRLWLYRVVNSKCKDLFRNRKMTLMDSDHEMIRNYVTEERREASGDAQMKYHCDQDVILGMIDELPHGQRIVLMMYYLEQCSIKEIAQLLEIPQGTVKSRMSTGKAALKSKIAQYEQREQIKLSFHSLDALLASVFVKAIQTSGIALPLGKPTKLHFSVQTHWMQGIAAVSCVTVLSLGMFAYGMERQASAAPDYVAAEENVQNTGITSTQAYFYLLARACCEDEILRMDLQELKQLEGAYRAIVREHAYHYELLKERGWIDAYERRINE
ncbi:MAG: sigma-70 family RNA polymerase sigma factor [Erysipelotrichaceae bacterium]|nr:sigma-70 family RNA polymerase sigma factor [Erysipelotrichaceae bacterium]